MAAPALPPGFDSPPLPCTDHVYKVVHGVPVSLRVWKAASGKAPWFFWIHGGGFSAGYEHRIAPWIHAALYPRYNIVSVGYRLAPQVSFDEQLQDIADAWAWCHANLASVVGIDTVDLDRSVTGGESAGGCLALRTAFMLEPRPKVVVDLYGPTLLSDPHFYVAPDNVNDLLAKIEYSRPRTTAELEAALVDCDPKKAKTIYPWWWDLEAPVEQLQSTLGYPGYTHGDDERLRMDLYKYMSIKRCRFSSVFRKSSFPTESEFSRYLDGHSSLLLLDSVEQFPPTFFLHGTGDTACPVIHSQAVLEKLRTKGIPCGSAFPDGLEHSFDVFIQPGDNLWKSCIEPLVAFLDRNICRS